MNDVEIDNLAAIGVIRDIRPFQLPPEALSLGDNVRARNNGIERMLGWQATFGATRLYAPHFAMPLTTGGQTYWLYVSLTKAAVWNGAVDTDITRAAGGDYSAAETAAWNGTILGGVPLFNNGVDIPQVWLTPTIATKLTNLANWPSTMRARIIRAFGPYLVAFNITQSGSAFPHLVHWSHPADPGSVPVSWDQTDATRDAGRKDLPDVNAGPILEAQMLQGKMYIYKEGSIWRMTQIGGRFIFDFDTFLENVGILASRCVAPTPDGLWHVMVTQDDMIKHNGNDVVSLLDAKQKKALFDEMDSVNYINSFMFLNAPYNEIWFCYPSSGQTNPDKALVWNYREGGKTGVITNVSGINFRNAISGRLESATDELWSDGTDTWEEDTGPWSEVSRRKLIACAPAASKFYVLDSGNTRDGVTYSATLQREGLSLTGKDRQGNLLVDHKQLMMYSRMWPKVSGGPVRIRFASQMFVDGPVSWGDYAPFDPTTQMTADILKSGRALGYEISTVDPVAWRVEGFKLDLTKLGNF